MGLNDGEIYFFGDFERQAIYIHDPISIIDSRLSFIPRFSLRINCRNTPRIADYIQWLGGLKPKYTKIRRPDNQIDPEIHIYHTDLDQRDTLHNILIDFDSAGRILCGKDIIVLSPSS